jgi:hypothetical protein
VYIAGLLTAPYNGAPQFPVTSGTYGSGATSFGQALFTEKLASDGTEIYGTVIPSTSSINSNATYLGGIAVDPQGDVYISGTTAADLPTTTGALLSTFPQNAGSAGFLLGLNPTASALMFATYLPGTLAPHAPPLPPPALWIPSCFHSHGRNWMQFHPQHKHLYPRPRYSERSLRLQCHCNLHYTLPYSPAHANSPVTTRVPSNRSHQPHHKGMMRVVLLLEMDRFETHYFGVVVTDCCTRQSTGLSLALNSNE